MVVSKVKKIVNLTMCLFPCMSAMELVKCELPSAEGLIPMHQLMTSSNSFNNEYTKTKTNIDMN